MGKNLQLVECAAVLFDMDGVLVDSSPVIERSWKSWAARHNISQEKLMPLIHGRKALDTIAMVAPQLDAQAEWQVLIKQELEDPQGPSVFAGVGRLLGSLPQGRWAIVTSAPKSIALARLQGAGLPVPDVLICAQDIARGKPHPDGYLAAARALKVAPEKCVVVEDALPGIDSAHAAGMRALAVATTHAENELTMADWCLSEISRLEATASDSGLTLRF